MHAALEPPLPPRRCEDGYYAAAGSSSCLPCPAGSFRNSYFDGAVAHATVAQCWKCPVGYFAANTGTSRCEPCPAGTFASVAGSSVCTPCADGTSSFAGTTVASMDPETGADTVVNLAAKGGACVAHTKGFYTDTAGTPVALPCRPGTYLDGTGDLSICLTCSQGTYNAKFAQGRATGNMQAAHRAGLGLTGALCGNGNGAGHT